MDAAPDTAIATRKSDAIPLSAPEESSSTTIDAEVKACIDALQFATQTEIQLCMDETGPDTLLHHYLEAFQQSPRVPSERIKDITKRKTHVDHNILRAGINKPTANQGNHSDQYLLNQ